MRELEGVTLNHRYFLRKFIASGGMADVYMAWDQLRMSQMAVKVLRRDLACNPRFFQMFAKEAELLRKLEHPSIVRLYEFDRDQGTDTVYIVMDWIDGMDVRRLISQRRGPLDVIETLHILEPVCRALNYAHQNQVFHCDVKPANILLSNDKRVLLSDFGVARHSSENTWGGTPYYMAPEQFPEMSELGQVNARTDVYALGVTLYEMLTGGALPYRGDTPSIQGQKTRERVAWEIRNISFRPVRTYNQNIPQAVDEVVQRALNREQARRYRSALEMSQAFDAALSNQVTLTNIPQLPSQPIRSSGGNVPPVSTSVAPPPYPPVQVAQQVSQGVPVTPPATPVVQSVSSPAQPKGPHLYGRTGEWASRAVEIPRSGLTIGRSRESHLHLREPSVSRIHASIIRQRIGKGIFLRDENSSMGVYLNGQRVQAGAAIPLKTGDIIQIGYYQVFEFREK